MIIQNELAETIIRNSFINSILHEPCTVFEEDHLITDVRNNIISYVRWQTWDGELKTCTGDLVS